MGFIRIFRVLFANSYMRPFEQSFFFTLYAPMLKPWVQRVVQREYMQPWTLLFVIWAIAMAALPTITFLSSFLLQGLSQFTSIPRGLITTAILLVQLLIGGIEVWGIYYITRLHLTKLFYWHRSKYPDWPNRPIWFQMDRYMFRPEVFALVFVTFFWLQLGNFMQYNDLLALQNGGWISLIQLWLPWVGGAVWPMVSIFYHRQLLEL